MSHTDRRVCSECEVDLGAVPAPAGATSDGVTHGFCDPCLERLYPDPDGWVLEDASPA